MFAISHTLSTPTETTPSFRDVFYTHHHIHLLHPYPTSFLHHPKTLSTPTPASGSHCTLCAAVATSQAQGPAVLAFPFRYFSHASLVILSIQSFKTRWAPISLIKIIFLGKQGTPCTGGSTFLQCALSGGFFSCPFVIMQFVQL